MDTICSTLLSNEILQDWNLLRICLDFFLPYCLSLHFKGLQKELQYHTRYEWK